MSKIVNKKIFLDAVHGYIYVPPDFSKKIIDTPNFQRLKRLEQTNIRPLFPCAHHDRFIHSLGTYHLGTKAFQAIKSNSKGELKEYHFNWDEAKLHFELACLLHDVGHAPFSHTCEMYFEIGENLDNYLINNLNIANNLIPEYKLFKSDYKLLNPKPKPHEKTSAILVLTVYYNVLKNDFHLDPFKIARMILGCKFNDTSFKDYKFYNCLIELLNGSTIDVDKLDYIARDQWASGYISKNIDYERLLSSIYIKPNKESELVICFHKRAMSELYALIEVKNIIRVRLHSHHIVKYDMYVLQEALVETAKQFYVNTSNNNEDAELEIGDAIHKIISIKALLEEVDFNGFKIKYPIDDDLIFILKSNIENSEYAKEWFYRDYRLRPVWKTYADFRYYFNTLLFNSSQEENYRLVNIFSGNREEIIRSFLKQHGYKEDNYYICPEVNDEYNPIYNKDINIFIKDQIIKFEKLITSAAKDVLPNYYFLLYLPKNIIESKLREDFVEYVISETKSGKFK